MTRPAPWLLSGAVAGSILAVSTAAVLVRASDAPPIAVAFHRLLYATLALLPFALWRARAELRALRPRDWLGLAGVGVALAIHFAAWIASLSRTTVAASVVLVTLHPVLVALVSRRLYGEGLPPLGFAGVALALGGGALVALGDASEGPEPLLGDALALLGAAAVAVYFLAGRGYRRRLGLLTYVTPVYGFAALALAAMLLAFPPPDGGPLLGYPAREHLLFLALALVPMLLGHTVLNWALRHLSAPVVATTVLGEPLGASLLAFLVFAEVPGPWVVAGGLVSLAGITIVALAGPGARPPPPRRAPG